MTLQAYPTNIARLISGRNVMSLDAGTPETSIVEQLDNIFIERLFGNKIIVDKTSARLCVAGLWLLYDHLRECHKTAQLIETPDGGYWHAVMHRREGDFSNSKYWYRNVGEHEIFPTLYKKAKEIVSQNNANSQINLLFEQSHWNSFAFVDLCDAAVQRKGVLERICQNIQQIEWQLLFDHCYMKALG
jgi:hypothetical protein